ncbi:MAG: anti-sigma factor [Dermatophilaceae bacterium]
MTDPQRDAERGHDFVQELLAAYLLDAVDEHDRLLVEEHLLTCPDCERELAALAPTVETLALAPTPVAPPSRVRDAVLRGIGSPTGADAQDRTTETSAAVRAAPVDDLAARRHTHAGRRLSLLVAAAAAVALFMFLAIGPFRGATPDVTTETVAAATDAERFEARIGDATATVIVSREMDKVAIETQDMAPAPEGRDYQLWFSHPDGSVTDAGVMPREADAAMVLDDEMGDAVGVALTLEPEGGSSQPTSEPMVVIPFEA